MADRMADRIESASLRMAEFFARYEASNIGATQIEWPQLFLGLIRTSRNVVRNFLGSHEAVVGLCHKLTEVVPARPKESKSVDIPMAADCKALVEFADRAAAGQLRRDAALEALFVGLLKNQPDWFRQYGLDADVVAAAFAYPPLNPPVGVALKGVPADLLEFRGVLDEMEDTLRPMPEERANERGSADVAWSRKQLIGFLIDRASNQHQLCIRALVSQELEVSFPDCDPAVWVEASGYQEMSWRVLLDLCITYHRFLYDLCNQFPGERFSGVMCRVGNKQPQSLADLLHEYVAQLNRSVREFPRC